MPQKYSKIVWHLDAPWWTYDIVIAIGLLATAALAIFGWKAGGVGGAVVSAIGALGFLTLVWGSFIEPGRLVVRRYRVGTGNGGKTIRVAFFSDLHVGPFKRAAWVAKVVKAVNALEPDLVLLGGDYIYERENVGELEPLKGLKARLGTFGVMGNHDQLYDEAGIDRLFRESGIRLLRNASVRPDPAASWRLAGVDDDWYGDTDFAAAGRDLRPDEPLIYVVHNPDLARYAANFGPKLILAGHTHGGQIRLPFIGPVPGLPHHLGRKFSEGVFRITSADGRFKEVPLVITEGAGEAGPRARLFCPPEVVLIEYHL